MINQDTITSLINKQFVYHTSNNQNLRMYVLRGIERMTNEFAVCKVVDKSHDSKTGNKQVFKTLHFGRMVPDQPSFDPRLLA